MLVCAEMLVILHGLWGRALKADRALLKPIMISKADSTESGFVGARKLVEHFMSNLV
jgi:hypothetical protein